MSDDKNNENKKMQEDDQVPAKPDAEAQKNVDQGQRIKDLEDRLLRSHAEFDNYRKRTLRDMDFVRETSAAELILKLLPTIDEFEIALSHIHASQHKDFARGMQIIFSKFLDALRKEGLQEMKCLSEQFDPYRHDAIRQAEGEEGKIIEVVQNGYLFKNKILRYAKVVVGNGKGGNKNE